MVPPLAERIVEERHEIHSPKSPWLIVVCGYGGSAENKIHAEGAQAVSQALATLSKSKGAEEFTLDLTGMHVVHVYYAQSCYCTSPLP